MTTEAPDDGAKAPADGRSAKISEVVARAIVHDIVAEDKEPGTLLGTEKDLLDTYGVSRASLREALRFLEIQGFVHVRAGPAGGPVVTEPTADAFAKMASLYFFVSGATVRELLDARMAVDSLMAALAATNFVAAPEETQRELRAQLDASLEYERTSHTEARYRVDRLQHPLEFHRLIGQQSGNRVLIYISHALSELYSARITDLPVPKRLTTDSLDSHRRIAAAICDGDAEGARAEMVRHLQEYIDRWTRTAAWAMEARVDWHA